jgi:hypothetical protein
MNITHKRNSNNSLYAEYLVWKVDLFIGLRFFGKL